VSPPQPFDRRVQLTVLQIDVVATTRHARPAASRQTQPQQLLQPAASRQQAGSSHARDLPLRAARRCRAACCRLWPVACGG
jgi:hypothetical protein